MNVDLTQTTDRPSQPKVVARAVDSAMRLLSRDKWLVADQALVSSMNFLTAVVLARTLGLVPFGVFSLFYIVLLYILSLQTALIVDPMVSLAPQIEDEHSRQEYLRGIAGSQYLFAGGTGILAFLATFYGTFYLEPQWFHPHLALPFALAVASYQCQDWLRRYYYVRESGKAAFLNDLVSYTGQVVAFIGLYATGSMNLVNAYYAIGLTSLVAFLIGLFTENIFPSLADVKRAVAPTWRLGTSLLATSQFQWLASQGVQLVSAAIIGTGDISGIRAVGAVVGPLNVVLQLTDNVFPVRAARAYARGGRAELVLYLRKSSFGLIAAISLPLLAVTVFSRQILGLCFGTPFVAFASLIYWQVLYYVLTLVCRQIQYYHRTLSSPRVLAQTAGFASIAVIASSFFLAKAYRAEGVMMALVVGKILNTIFPLWKATQFVGERRAEA